MTTAVIVFAAISTPGILAVAIGYLISKRTERHFKDPLGK